jgi:hypothetical protein
MITSLHYRAAMCAPHGTIDAMRDERLSRLAQISKEYRKTIADIKESQRTMSVEVAASVVEDILQELKKIAEPIFRSLTQLDVEYLAFRMQQMAVLSEGMLAIDQIKKNADRVVVSTEINKVFDELKVAMLEIGYDFHHSAPAEQLNQKIENLRQRKLAQYSETMERYRQDILQKKTALEDLSKQMRAIERETGLTLKDLIAKGKFALFVGGNVSMPLTEVLHMIYVQREYGSRGEGF